MGDGSSQRSSSSYRSSATARIRAKAEAARIRLDFTRKELEVIRQKAKAELQQTEFEAELRLLAEEKEAAAAEAEASYLEAEEMDRHSSRNSRRSSPLRHNRERTENYIQEMNSLRQAGQLAAVHPEGGQFQSPTLGQDHTASFLFKRELLWKNKISVFNEQPESFKVWKHDFQSAMLELNVSPAEELTILIKHLGTESRKYAESLQAANASNPKRGLTMLWERLEERYGAPELLESCLKTKLDKFPTISNREPRKLYELSDLLEEIQSAKHDPKLSPLFAVYDSSTGVNTIVAKLPHSLRQKWVAKASNYKMEQGVPFPPFCIFVDFVKTWARVENDPAFQFDLQPVTQNKNGPRQIFNRKTGVENTELCPIHNARHPLTACKSFAAKTFQEKKAFLREKNLCFKCLASSQHTAKECTASVQCEKCQKKHCTVMHRDSTLIGPVQSSSSPSPLSALPTAPEPSTQHGGEDQSVLTRCTALCKQKNASRSCGKIVKVYVFPENHPEQKTEVYAILDDQSNCSLATPFVMNKLATHQEEIDYKLTSCAGTCSMSGRLIQNLNVQAFESETTLKLPSVLECSKIPQDRSEIPTSEVAQHHPHLRSIAKHIPHLNQGAPIALLIGRDMPEAHHVLEQVVGPPMSPFAQRMPLGWVIVGDVCLNKMHKPSAVSTFKTHVMNSSRGSIFEPCPYDLRVSQTDQIGSTVFEKHPEDEKIGMSVDDRKFLTLMDQQFQKNEEDRWSAPLPLRSANAISTSNRVERIRQSSRPEQWQYVPTDLNPADAATRSATEDLSQKQDMWLHGPTQFLANSPNTATQAETESYSLISPDSDSEIRPSVCKTDVSALSSASTVASRFGKFSSWDALVRALCLLRHICHSFHNPTEQCRGWHQCQNHRSVESLQATEKFIIQTVQAETFAPEIDCLRKGNQLPRSSSIVSLSPYLDEDELLRVGGRLTKATESLGLSSVHPVILPKNHDVSVKLVQHYHHKVEHQGRHFTEGALRSAGFWVIGAKRLVASMIQRCFTCKRLRGKRAHQQMANLPADRVHPSAPFSHVGIDVFGPWSVVTRKTRGGLSNSKRWAVIFTCMAIRAIHIEVLEEMSSSSFINALRRFIALRGPVTELRSDRGTNFVGAAGELQLDSFFVEHGPVREHLLKTGIAWKFNPPHASHMGGSWERLIGVIRRILDAMLLDKRRKPLTHEVLTTLMAEVCAIVNSRPIVPISHDPDFPQVLTPSMLLTMKCGQDTVSCGSTDMKETYKRQWKHVQVLSNTFWKHWKAEYLQSLQQRSKWQNQEADLKEGDLVLLHDSGAHRNDWPIALVIRTFPSDDGHVRTVELRVVRNGQPASFVRPVTELVPL